MDFVTTVRASDDGDRSTRMRPLLAENCIREGHKTERLSVLGKWLWFVPSRKLKTCSRLSTRVATLTRRHLVSVKDSKSRKKEGFRRNHGFYDCLWGTEWVAGASETDEWRHERERRTLEPWKQRDPKTGPLGQTRRSLHWRSLVIEQGSATVVTLFWKHGLECVRRWQS